MSKRKIAVLANNPNLYSNIRIMEAGRQRGHEMHFIKIKECFMNVSVQNPEIHLRGKQPLQGFDAVIPRIKPSLTFFGTAVLHQFKMMRVYCLNEPNAILESRDKLRALQLLACAGIDLPVTGFANSPLDTRALIKIVGGAPLIVKLLEGTQGKGVVLADTDKAAVSVINAFKTLNANILVQKFIKEACNKDIRCFVIGNKVVAAMQRAAPEGEFRANVHLGATVSPIELTPQERKMAIKSAKTVGLVVAGVDIIRAHDGPKVLEVNSSPGLEGIESVTGLDIAGLMIDFIDKALA